MAVQDRSLQFTSASSRLGRHQMALEDYEIEEQDHGHLGVHVAVSDEVSLFLFQSRFQMNFHS